MKKGLIWWTSIICLILLSALGIYIIERHTYIYVCLVWLVIISLFIRFAKTDKLRLTGIYIGSFILAFFLAEVYFSGILGFRYKNRISEDEVFQGGYDKSHEWLGYALLPNSKWRTKLSYGDSVAFDVIHSVDSEGLRLTTGELKSGASPIIFFGCSFTFGHGLNDNETLPSNFQSATGGQINAINMGQNSYGAHQMLISLEKELEKKYLKGNQPIAAVYSAITDHTFRGTRAFGPKYELDSKNKPQFTGMQTPGSFGLLDILSKSYTFRRYFSRRKASDEKEVNLLVAMIEESARLFNERYNAPFYCLLWHELHSEEGLYEKILHKLKARNINVIEVAEILPNYEEQPEQYLLHMDGHPNALANRLIGEYLSKFLSEKE